MKSLLARCLLFTPGNRPERFAKAADLGADGIIIDLEDAISLSEKDSAREIVIQYFKEQSTVQSGSFLRCLRINSVKTRAGLKDLSSICDAKVKPDVLVLPKTESAEEINLLNLIFFPEVIPILPLIESAKGLSHADEIAVANNVCGLLFGGADMAADLGATMSWDALYAARAEIVRAAAIAGITAVDVPYLHMHDQDDTGLIEETKRIVDMGFRCKSAIHPKHINAIMSTLTPTDDEVNHAMQVVEAYEKAGGNACELNGKMIDVPVYRSAKRILAISHH